jgi:hypothetical protein
VRLFNVNRNLSIVDTFGVTRRSGAKCYLGNDWRGRVRGAELVSLQGVSTPR